ncbi:MAG: hypothetical protein VX424_03205 [Actinomycetota bacterium]|nr:hypothetical protein [Actinomycetota bacterium]
MAFRGVGETRRWQRVIAVAAALGVFIALATGSALRQSAAAAAPPEPTAWSASTVDAHAGPMPGRLAALSRPASTVSLPSAPANKTNKKPLGRAWMTKERPLTWNRLSAQSLLTPVPLSFTPIVFAPGGARSRAPAAIAFDRDILTEVCVARR